MILGDFWFVWSYFLIAIVRILICVGTMAAPFYNQITLSYNQTVSPLLYFIPRERSEWALCYSRDENGRQLAIEL